jgi:DNA-binding response OmpR family regulator
MPSLTVPTQFEPKRQAPLTVCAASGEPAILVVEDDDGIRRFICTLFAMTETVIEAAGPDAAFPIARKLGRRIALLISDVNLSASLNGVELARELAMADPSMKVLLMSAADGPGCKIPSTWRFLAKPFSIKSLLDCVITLCSSAAPLKFTLQALVEARTALPRTDLVDHHGKAPERSSSRSNSASRAYRGGGEAPLIGIVFPKSHNNP